MERFKSKTVLLCVGVLVLTLVSGGVLGVMKIYGQPVSVPTSKIVSVSADKQALRSSIKLAFETNDEKGILAYLDLALEQKQPLQGYLYIKKAFDRMTVSYKSAKAAEKKLAMAKLQAYATSLPNYKESDFIIPK